MHRGDEAGAMSRIVAPAKYFFSPCPERRRPVGIALAEHASAIAA